MKKDWLQLIVTEAAWHSPFNFEVIMKEDNKHMAWALAYLCMGIAVGFGIAMAVVDDLEEFRIPCTDKVFVRKVIQGN